MALCPSATNTACEFVAGKARLLKFPHAFVQAWRRWDDTPQAPRTDVLRRKALALSGRNSGHVSTGRPGRSYTARKEP